MIKAIIFDFGNVIFKTDFDKVNKEFIKKYGISVKVNDKLELRKIYLNTEIGRDKIENLFRKINPDINNKELITFYKKSYLKNKKINKKLIVIIKKLKKRYILYGFTDTNQVHFDANLKEGIFKGFKKIFTSFEFGKRKSDEISFNYLIKKIKLKPNECLFIDDYKLNIKNARKKGLKTIHYIDFPKINNLKKDLRKYNIKW